MANRPMTNEEIGATLLRFADLHQVTAEFSPWGLLLAGLISFALWYGIILVIVSMWSWLRI